MIPRLACASGQRRRPGAPGFLCALAALALAAALAPAVARAGSLTAVATVEGEDTTRITGGTAAVVTGTGFSRGAARYLDPDQTFRFTGSAVDLILASASGQDAGLRVYVDGALRSTVVKGSGLTTFTVGGLAEGSHTLTFVNNGPVVLDRAVVYSTDPAPPALTGVIQAAGLGQGYAATDLLLADGDGQQEMAQVYFGLTRDAVVTAAVRDASGNVVRTLVSGQSYTVSGDPAYGWNHRIDWDATDGTGTPVPEGVYTLTVQAAGSGGEAGTPLAAAYRVLRSGGVAVATVEGEDGTRVAGTAGTVAADRYSAGGARLLFNGSGAIAYAFSGTGADVTLASAALADSEAAVTVDGVRSVVATRKGDAPVTFAIRGLAPGDHILQVAGTRATGVAVDRIRVYGAEATPAFERAEQRAALQGAEVAADLLLPDGDGNYDEARAYYGVTRDAYLTALVRDAAGTPVRTLFRDRFVTVSGAAAWGWLDRAVWDGRDDAGQPVPAGTYTLEVQARGVDGRAGVPLAAAYRLIREPGRATATLEAEDTTRIGGYPVTLAGARFSNGKARVVTSVAGGGISYTFAGTGVDVTLAAAALEARAAVTVDGLRVQVPLLQGDRPATFSLRGLAPGTHTLQVAGAQFSGTAAPVAVDRIQVYGGDATPAVERLEPRVSLQGGEVPGDLLIPDGDGNHEEARAYYGLTRDGYVTVRVRDAAGNVVRTAVQDRFVTVSGTEAWGWADRAAWDGRDDAGQPVPQGLYRLEVQARGVDGSSGQPVTLAYRLIRDSGPVTATVEAEDSTRVSGPATFLSGPQFSNRKARTVTVYSGAGLGFTFSGIGADITLGAAAGASSQAAVTVDGVTVAVPVLAGDAPATFSLRGLAPGSHTLQIAGATADAVAVDRIRVYGPDATPELVRASQRVTLQSGEVAGDLLLPDGDGNHDRARLYFGVTRDAYVTAVVRDAAGQAIRTVEADRFVTVSATEAWGWLTRTEWDGRDEAGSPVPEGTYTLEVQARGVDGRAGPPLTAAYRVVRDSGLATATLEGEDATRISGSGGYAVGPAYSNRKARTVSSNFGGSGLSYTFSGTGLDVTLAAAEGARSEAAVSVDGVRVVVPVSPGDAPATFSIRGLAPGPHALQIAGTRPEAVAVDRITVYGTDATPGFQRVERRVNLQGGEVGVDLLLPDGDGNQEEARLYFAVTRDADVTAVVRDAAGQVIRTLEAGRRVTVSGKEAWGWVDRTVWDGRDDAGRAVAAGTYALELRARGMDGSAAEPVTVAYRVVRDAGLVTATVEAEDTTRVPGGTATVFDPRYSGQVARQTDSGQAPLRFSFSGTGVDVSLAAADLFASEAAVTLDGVRLAVPVLRGDPVATLGWRGLEPGPHTLEIAGTRAAPVAVDRIRVYGTDATPAIERTRTAVLIQGAEVPGDLLVPDGDQSQDAGRLYYAVTRDALVTATVLAEDGRPVRTLARDRQVIVSGTRAYGWTDRLEWDARDDAGALVLPGTYTVEVTARGADGSLAGPWRSTWRVRAGGAAAVTLEGEDGTRISGPAALAFDDRFANRKARALTDTAGARLVFTGTGADLVLAAYGGQTAAVIYVDGARVAELPLRLNAPPAVYSIRDLPPGRHTLEVFSRNWVQVALDRVYLHVPEAPPALDRFRPSVLIGQAGVEYDLLVPDGNRSQDILRLAFSVTRDARVDAVVRDASGRAVRTLLSGLPVIASGLEVYGWELRAEWDGLDDQRRPVPDGTYALEVTASGPGGQAAAQVPVRVVRNAGHLSEAVEGEDTARVEGGAVLSGPYSGGGARAVSTATAPASFSFNGRGADLILSAPAGNGEVETTVDGKAVRVPVYRADGQVVFSVRGLGYAAHAVTLKGLTAAAVALDRALVYSLQPPGPEVLSPEPGFYSTEAAVTFTGTAGAGTRVQATVAGALAGEALAGPDGRWTLTARLADGDHLVSFTAYDAGGVASLQSASLPITVDTVPPAAPTLAIDQVAAGGATSAADLTLRGSAEAGARVTVWRGGAAVAAAAADAAGAWSVTLTGVPEGAAAFTATATDRGGRQSPPGDPYAVTVDRTPPETRAHVTGTLDPEGLYEAPVQFSLSAEDAGSGVARSEYSLDGATWLAYDGPVTLADEGAYTIRYRSVDAAGNTEAARTTAFGVTERPRPPVVTSPADDFLASRSPVAFAGTAQPGRTVQVLEGGRILAEAVADAGGQWSLAAALTDGAHSLQFVAVARGRSSDPVPLRGRVDTTPPAIAILGVADGADYTGAAAPEVRVTGTFLGEDDVESVAVTLNGQPWQPGALTAPGAYVLAVSATDRAGNRAGASVSFRVYAPTLLTLEEAAGEYSDAVALAATLSAGGQPVAGQPVVFRVAGQEAGRAETDAAGRAVLIVPVQVPAGGYPVEAEFGQSDAAFLRGSQAAARLQVSPEKAALEYAGDTRVVPGQPARLAARVIQEADGAAGDLTRASVVFTLTRLAPDGSLQPAGSFPAAMDAAGLAEARAELAPGVYTVQAALAGNGYFAAEPALPVTLAVHGAGAVKIDATLGAKSGRLNLKGRFADQDGAEAGTAEVELPGRRLHLRLARLEWAVLAGRTAFIQGELRAKSGAAYGFRAIAEEGGRTDRLLVWVNGPGGEVLFAPDPAEVPKGSVRFVREK